MAWGVTPDEHRSYQSHRGEAGLEHLTRELHQLRFEREADIQPFLRTLLGTDQTPDVVVTDFAKRNRQGTYNWRESTIRVRSHLRVGTVVHELAHHVQRMLDAECGRWSQSHGKEFKKALRHLAKNARTLLGLPKAKPRPRIRALMVVEILDMDRRRAEVLWSKGRGYWAIRTLDDDRRLVGHKSNLLPVG